MEPLLVAKVADLDLDANVDVDEMQRLMGVALRLILLFSVVYVELPK